MVIEQIKHQLDRMVPVYRVVDMTLTGRSIERELAMVKVRGTGEHRVEALRLAEAFRARVIDATNESFVFEITGDSAKINQFIDLMRPLGLVEVRAPASPPSRAEPRGCEPCWRATGIITNGGGSGSIPRSPRSTTAMTTATCVPAPRYHARRQTGLAGRRYRLRQRRARLRGRADGRRGRCDRYFAGDAGARGNPGQGPQGRDPHPVGRASELRLSAQQLRPDRQRIHAAPSAGFLEGGGAVADLCGAEARREFLSARHRVRLERPTASSAMSKNGPISASRTTISTATASSPICATNIRPSAG